MLKTFLLLCGNHETLFTGYFDEWKVEKNSIYLKYIFFVTM